jgi:hypothetical protein
MSGKAIHETVPPAGTAIWEMLKALEESERHTFCAASFITERRSTSRTKADPGILPPQPAQPVPISE